MDTHDTLLDSRVDRVSSRLDAVAARLDPKIDALCALVEQLERHAAERSS